MEQKFDRSFASLEAVFAFIHAFMADREIDDSVEYSINLAVEELFTNMVKYNAGGGDHILIGISEENRKLEMRLVDFDVDPFDPNRVNAVDVDAPIEERTPGGLGLHLVKSVVDKIMYEYKDRQMTVTVIKNLER